MPPQGARLSCPFAFVKTILTAQLFSTQILGTLHISESELEEAVEVECFLVQFVLFGFFIVYNVLEKE